MKTFEDHLRERQSQNYASTRRWALDSEETGLRGERALAQYFGAQQDLTNKPHGDGGCDLQIALRHRCTIDWFTVDAKASRKGGSLLVNRDKIKPKTIYVMVIVGDLDYCVGWEWGARLAKEKPVNWGGNGVWVHALHSKLLRDMFTLKLRCVGWRHADKS